MAEEVRRLLPNRSHPHVRNGAHHRQTRERGRLTSKFRGPDSASVLRALEAVRLADGTALANSERLSEVTSAAGRISFAIRITPDEAAVFEPLRRAAEAAVRALAGVERVLVTLTAERTLRKAPRLIRPSPDLPRGPRGLPGVAWVVAIASGKGGVGKSTTACNLAIALRARGLQVGMLDADIYGPSQPSLFGLAGEPRLLDDRRLAPMDAFGVKVMSMGVLIKSEQALVWRGPMVLSAITQMIREVAWAPLDLLLVDLPPGTGDASLAIAEELPLAGAVIVSTPQDLALIDVRRGIAMFAKLGVPVLGIVENMAHFTCTTCGAAHDIFGTGGARAEAARLGLTCLGEVPLARALRESADAGRPIVAIVPEDPIARAYFVIADGLLEALRAAAASPLATPVAPEHN